MGFCWPVRSSSGVDPLLTFTPGRVGISLVVQKNLEKITESGRKKQTNIDSELQTQESEVGTLAF